MNLPQRSPKSFNYFKAQLPNKKIGLKNIYQENAKEGEVLPYHQNFGITESEYGKIKSLEKQPLSIVIKKTSTVTVNRSTSTISFESPDEDFGFFEELIINLANRSITFLDEVIPFSKAVIVPGNYVLGEWSGFTWSLEESNMKESEPIKIDKLVSKIMTVTIGKIKASGKTYLNIKYKSVNKGDVLANFEVSCFLF